MTVTVPVVPAPVRRRRRCHSGTGARRYDAAGGADTHRERPRERRDHRHDAALSGRRQGGFTVTAAAGADVARVDFSALGAGWFGGGSDATAPFTAAYGFSLASVAPFTLTAVASDAAGNASAPARLNVVGDGAGRR